MAVGFWENCVLLISIVSASVTNCVLYEVFGWPNIQFLDMDGTICFLCYIADLCYVLLKPKGVTREQGLILFKLN